MAFLDKQEVRELLKAARATGDYCMLTGKGGDRAEKLIDALSHFDGAPDDVTLDHLVDLRKAMRDVCRGIDDYTLTRILAGDPPIRLGPNALLPGASANGDDTATSTLMQARLARLKASWPAVWQRVVLPGLAVVLLLGAMHFTHWSFNANLLLSRLDDHISTDVHEEIRDLIVVARAIQTNGADENAPSSGTPAQKVFNETMSKLTAFHHQERELRKASLASVASFDVVAAARSAIGGLPAKLFGGRTTRRPATPPPPAQTAVPAPEETVAMADNVVEAIDEIDQETTDKIAIAREDTAEMTAALPAEAAEEVKVTGMVDMALAGHSGFLAIVSEIAKITGRDSMNPGDHVVSRLELLRAAEDVKEKISVANRFYLPMIYGSLGAALFCLVRVLTPSLSDLGPARAFLRVLFGAFAAMTLSMLFIPANIFTINEASNPTLIFLACFLFGYSFDAVLSALHRMEAFLQGRLQPQEAGRAG